MSTQSRKEDHLRIPAELDVQSMPNPWHELRLRHNAVPERDLADVDTKTTFLGHSLGAPFLISGMTGGTPLAATINRRLAKEAGNRGWAMGVGSQRAALEDPSLASSFDCSEAPLRFANLGMPQLIRWDDRVEKARAAVEMVDAHAICVHLNTLQEAIQPEGDTDAKGGLAAIAEVAAGVGVPVIAKETGAGIDGAAAKQLADAGVAAIDVGGAGGTSFSAVEHYRASDAGDAVKAALGRTFWDWGNPTPRCVAEVRSAVDIPVIASGGLTSGLDAAKAFALGADLAGFAGHLFRAAIKGEAELALACDILLEELKTTLFLTGVQHPEFLGEDHLA
ncbi:MAG: type 2 isopentenyl-diphosphate Delta-isomerase [Thermoplasmatota archaeon]